MIIVKNICKEGLLATDENGILYKTKDTSFSIGDIVPIEKCIKATEAENKLFNNCNKLISLAESKPDLF